MTKRNPTTASSDRVGVTIGRERFAAISAVDGIELTPEMKERAAELARRGLTAEERIRAIVAAHRKR